MRVIFAVVLLALIALACTQQEAPQGPTAPTTPAADTPAPTQQETPIPALPQIDNREPNPDTVKLFSNIGKVKSYSFDVAFLPDARAQYRYAVLGNRAKVTLPEVATVRGRAIEVVYLDFTQGTAFGYCIRPAICPDLKFGTSLDFQQYNITLPPQWVDRLQYGARSRTFTFYDSPVTVVSLEEGGRYYEGYVQNFYGMPVRVAIATDKEMTNIIDGYEYRSMAFNTIKESDVTPPQ